MRQIARLHNDINGLKINQENLANQKARIEVRQGASRFANRGTQSEGCANSMHEKPSSLHQSATLQEEANTVRAEQQANNQRMAGISQELARQREHRSGLKCRQTVLNDLQNKREGVSQVVRELLKTRDAGKGFSYVKGMVADAISTDLQNAVVIEAALGDLQNAVIVSDSAALLADAELWQKLAGRVTVLAADKMLAYQDG